MLYNNEDEFLKTLANKISKLNPKQPSSNDWTDFEMAYRKHKNKNQRKKWLFVFWLVLFSMLCSGLIYFSNNQITYNETNLKNQIENQIIENKKSITKDSKIKTENAAHKAQNSNRILIHENLLFDENTKSKLTGKSKNNIVKMESKESVPEMNKPDAFNLDEQSAIYYKSNVQVLYGQKLKSLLISMPINKTILSTKMKNSSTDSIKMNALNTYTKSINTVRYFEIGLCVQNNNFTQLDYPSDQFFKGVGLNAGMRLQNNWSLNIGISAMYLNQVSIDKYTYQTEEHQIERIDTTIKYNINYNRLMMQFDTVLSYKNVNHEASSIYKNNIIFIHLPFQVRYHIGNEKRSVYAAIGATGTLVYQSQNITKNVGLNNERNQSKDTYSFMFAPTIGLGLHQKIYRNLDFHLASNYSKYLNVNLIQSNSFQLQTGLKYNF